jgi:hypothetical protein
MRTGNKIGWRLNFASLFRSRLLSDLVLDPGRLCGILALPIRK